MAAHAYEILAADWNKYNDCILATGSVDKSVKIWDVRMPQQPLACMLGHQCAPWVIRPFPRYIAPGYVDLQCSVGCECGFESWPCECV